MMLLGLVKKFYASLLFFIALATATNAVGSALEQYEDSVYLIFPKGSDQPTGVATLVHDKGYFVTTLHATNWEATKEYDLRQPGKEIVRPVGSHQKAFRVSNNAINEIGNISILQAENWDRWFAPNNFPKICLRSTSSTSFSGSYIMFTQGEWFHSEKDFRNRNGVFGVTNGVMPTESGALVMEGGQFGIGIVEAHLDEEILLDGAITTDMIRELNSNAEIAEVMLFTDKKNLEYLFTLPESEISKNFRENLSRRGSDRYRSHEFYQNFTAREMKYSIDALRVLDELLKREIYCSFVGGEARVPTHEFYVGAADFARNSCASGPAGIILADHFNTVVQQGLDDFCDIEEARRNNGPVPTLVFGDDIPTNEFEGRNRHQSDVLVSSNALASDVLQASLAVDGNQELDDQLQRSLSGALALLAQTRQSVMQEGLGEYGSAAVADSYLISAKLALSSESKAIVSDASEYLVASNEIRPSAEANLLLAEIHVDDLEFGEAREYLSVARVLDDRQAFSFEIAQVAESLKARARSGETVTIGITQNNVGVDSYQTTYEQAFISAAESYADVETVVLDAGGDVARQIAQLEDLIQQEVDAIVIWPTNGEAVIPAVRKAQNAGIPVIVTNSNIAEEGFDFVASFSGPDNITQGARAAEIMCEKFTEMGVEDEAQIVQISGQPGYTTAIERAKGFEDRLPEVCPNVTLVETQPGDWNREKSQKVMEAFLVKYDDIDGVYAGDDNMGVGALNAAKAAGRDGIIFVGATNFAVGYEAMYRGEYWGSIYQSPVDDAEAALQTAIDVLNGKDVPFLNYFDTPKITQDNMSEFTKPVF